MYTNYKTLITTWIHTHLLHYFNTFEDISFRSTIAPTPIQYSENYLGARNPQKWNVKKSYANNVDECSKDGYCWRRFTYPYKMIFCYSPVNPAHSWKSWMECLLNTFISLSSTNFNHRKQQDFVLLSLKTFPRTWVLKFSKQSLELQDIIYN